VKIVVTSRSGAAEFECEPGEKILHAGLRSGVELSYECGTGTCGTCKARLVDGRVDDGWPEAPGRKYLKGAGEFLMCQCAAAERHAG
jgi:toluene monooxygenase electron transfer component